MMIRYTTNRSYPKPDFDTRTWHDQMHQSLDMIDSDIGARNDFDPFIVAEIWRVGTSYTIGDVIVDSDDSTLWQANITHTSGNGTFALDRTANPTYWTSVGVQLRFRGAWTAATAYQIYDHVYDTNEGIEAICIVAHVSTTGIRADAANWKFIIDIQLVFTSAQSGQLILASQIFGG